MKNIILPTLITLLLFSCNTSKKQHQEDAKSPNHEAKIMIPQSNCFVSISGKDSIWLKIEAFPNVATGMLHYQFYEKDISKGTLEGKIVNNIFYGDYSYHSEGMQSVREVAFLLSDSTATEGFGEMVEQNGKMKFKDSTKIDFSKGIKFHRIDCVQNEKHFRVNP